MRLFKHQFKTLVVMFFSLAAICLSGAQAEAGGVAGWITVESLTTRDFNALWGADSEDVFAAGKNGTIFHYNGEEWAAMKSGTTSDLNSLWGVNGKNIFAAGNAGLISHYNGSAWSAFRYDNTTDFYGIQGISASEIYAVGQNGLILNFDGDNWTAMNSGTQNDLYAVWQYDSQNVYAVGESGAILYYNGENWSVMSSGTTSHLRAVWGSSRRDIFVAGDSGTMLHYDGTGWSEMTVNLDGDLRGLWGSNSLSVYAAGQSGIILHYDGTAWSAMRRDTVGSIRAVWGSSSTDVWAAGQAGSILRYRPPLVSSVSPASGDQGSIQTITIRGANLNGVTGIDFGSGIAINSFNVNNAGQITASIAIVAGAAPGYRGLNVRSEFGQYSLDNCFQVIEALPLLSAIIPDRERQGMTLDLTINGSNLKDISAVHLGSGVAVNSFTALSSSQIALNVTIAADAAPGTRDVSVVAAGGNFVLKEGFTVKQALPVLDSLSPSQANQKSRLNVTLNGANLNGATALQMGSGITLNSFTILSSKQISADISIAADADTGAREVSVTTPGGSITLPSGFNVLPALPVITAIDPPRGSQGATLNVSITGANLSGAAEVRLGNGVAVNNFSVVSDSLITAGITIISGTQSGARDVTVTTSGGSNTLSGGFLIVQGLPVITTVSPEQGRQEATLTLIISGSNLDGASAVSLGSGITVQRFTNLTSTQISVNVTIDPQAATGPHDITVTTPGGVSTLSNGFTVAQKSLGTLIVALIWTGIAVVVVLFAFVLYLLRKRRSG